MKESMMKPLLAIIAVNFIWGLDFIVIEYMMEYVSPAIFTLSRLVIGTVILLALVFVKHRGLHIKKEDWPRVFISGGVGMALYFTVENLGTGMTSASFSSLIMATVPVFGMIGDRIFYGNKINVNKNTLIPRYETEYLIEKTLNYIKKYISLLFFLLILCYNCYSSEVLYG